MSAAVAVPGRLMTTGEIARELGVSFFQVAYVIRSRQIRPVQRAGRMRLYSMDDMERVREELAIVASNKKAGIESTPKKMSQDGRDSALARENTSG